MGFFGYITIKGWACKDVFRRLAFQGVDMID
jgi:hypothetical protein